MTEFDLKKYAHLSPTEQIEEYHKFMAQKQGSQIVQQNQSVQEQPKTPATQLLNKIGPKTELVIGDRTYVLAHWSPTKMYRNIPKIGRYFAIPASTVIGTIFSAHQDEIEPDLSEAIPTALMYLFQTMEDNDIMDFYKIMFDDVYLNDKQVMSDFDGIFADNPYDPIDLLVEVLRINYVVPFSQKKGLSSLTNLAAISKPIMEIVNL
ncbi:hypothetical protein KLEP7_gp14 [Pseudaeromonas phage vB_PpeM_ KLEP7]|nr:hypothetical protein KLEP7_gp14 [Pseudaeromonas phage vB_PpeM_ KLEP7]